MQKSPFKTLAIVKKDFLQRLEKLEHDLKNKKLDAEMILNRVNVFIYNSLAFMI